MIPLMKNTFYKEYETKKALSEFILKTEILSMNKTCFHFEREFSKCNNLKEGILFNSGASSNLALLQSLKNLGKLKDGDRIGFSALTWATNIMPIIQLGMVPVPIDINPSTINVMSFNLKERLSQVNMEAFFATNVLGFLGDLREIKDFCEEAHIIFIEDNCESLGSEIRNEGKSGSFGLASTFSFFVAHHMSTIEGGMVCTSDEELAEMLKIVRANGWDRNLSSKQQQSLRKKYHVESEFYSKYTFYDLGYNLRPTEITGFIGLEQLKYLEEVIAIREKNFVLLDNIIKENNDLIAIEHNHLSKKSIFSVPVIAKSKKLRDKYFEKFSGAGVEIRPMIAGNIQNQPFYSKYVGEKYELKGTDFVSDNGFYFGNYPELNEQDLEILSNCLTDY